MAVCDARRGLPELGDLAAAESAAEAHDDLPNALDANREYLRARLELARGNAAAAAERLRKLAPELDLASTQYWLGRALEAQGDGEGARRRYEMARQRDPDWPPPVSALIGLAMGRGDWRAGVGLAQRLLQRHPGNEDAWLLISRGLIELEEGEAAEQATAAAKNAFPDKPAFRVYHAHALRLLGRHEEALAEIEETRDAFAEEPGVMAEAAIVLGMVGGSTRPSPSRTAGSPDIQTTRACTGPGPRSSTASARPRKRTGPPIARSS